MIIASDHWRYDTLLHRLWPADTEQPATEVSPEALEKYQAGLRALELFRRMFRRTSRLVVDSTKGCQLQCDYCYAEAGPKHGQTKVDPAVLGEIRARYGFEDVNMLGGDPLFDWAHTKACLKALGKVRKLSITTNGIGLSADRISTLKSCCETFELAISMEPPEWLTRVSGSHTQAEMMGDRVSRALAAHPDIKPTVFFTLPARPLDEPPSVKRALAFASRVLGRPEFVSKFSFAGGPTQSPIRLEHLSWASAMLAEEWDAISSPGYTLQRARSGLLGRYVGGMERAAGIEVSAAEAPYSAFTCMPGTADLSVGPDSRLYNCHEQGVRANDQFYVAEETPRSLWPSVRESIRTRNTGKAECPTCSARWWCGGLCHAWSNPLQCDFADRAVHLALMALDTLAEHAGDSTLARLAHAQDLWHSSLNTEEIHAMVETPTWDKLIMGELEIPEMQTFVEALGGKPVDPDAPLWTLPKLTSRGYSDVFLFHDSP